MDRQILFLLTLTEIALAIGSGILGVTAGIWIFGALAALGAISSVYLEWIAYRSRKALRAALATLAFGQPVEFSLDDFLNGGYDASSYLDDEEDAA
jgi:hypothetical protein